MSKKRTSYDQQTNDGSDSTFLQDDNAKRAKLTSSSDTTLQDLPVEMLEYILVKTVAMEVIETRLSRSVWYEKIDLVTDRLRTVSSLWNSIIATDIFRDKVIRTLIAEELVHLEILYQSPLQFCVSSITTLKDEIFLFGKPFRKDHLIKVYDRSNMDVVKDVIPMKGFRPKSITACTVSNCVYILNRKIRDHYSILRIASTNDHWSLVSPLTDEICLPQSTLCVTASGSVVLSRQHNGQFAAISVCDTNGSIQHEIKLPTFISRIWNIIPKSNGNLVLVANDKSFSSRVDLVEIDLRGNTIRRKHSAHRAANSVSSLADSYGRMFVADSFAGMKLLDSEFNQMDFTGHSIAPKVMHYNSARNEIVAVATDPNFPKGVLMIFHLREN